MNANLKRIALIWGLMGGLIAGPIVTLNYADASLRAVSRADLTAAGPIGSVTPDSGAFTTLTANNLFTLTGVENALTAHAGGTKAAALALSATKNFHRISVSAAAGDSILMPTATAGQIHYVRNDGVAAMQVFGAGTDTINGVATATGISHGPGLGLFYVSSADGAWTTSFNSAFAGTVAAPGLTNSGGTVGLYWSSNTLLFGNGTLPQFSLGSNFVGLASDGTLYFSSTTSAGGAVGTKVTQVSTGILGVGSATAIDGTIQAANHSQTGANGQVLAIQSLSELTTIAAAATTDTTIQMPANAVVLGVSVRVTVVIPTAATFTVGDSGSAARFNTAAVAVAANSTDPGTKAGAYYNASALSIRITPNLTPGANSGRVRVTIHYYVVTPPTS